jgi:hypothetical protein
LLLIGVITLASANLMAGPVRAAEARSVAPCGATRAVPHYSRVVWIVLENEGYSVIGSRDAPYLNHLVAECGLATNDDAVTHPSLPNYLALTSGSTQGVTDDGEPSAHRLFSASIFGQLHGNWRALAESMTEPCQRVSAGQYAARHNPAVYYRKLSSLCPTHDVALRWPLDLRAAFTFITPNICNDMHSCSIRTGDTWLSRAVGDIVSSDAYKRGQLVLFVTFDENNTDAANRVPMIVVAPSVPRGLRVGAHYTHYSLLATTERLLGLPYLGDARNAGPFTKAFRLSA